MRLNNTREAWGPPKLGWPAPERSSELHRSFAPERAQNDNTGDSADDDARQKKAKDGQPALVASTFPRTGIGA
jgi:hypothetical protein